MQKSLAITNRSVAELIPYVKNARTHTDAQIDAICLSLKEFGWTNPVLLDGANGIIAGHARVTAARKLRMETVPCIELAHLTEDQRRAYVIADNQLALRAGWDNDILRMELQELNAAGFDLAPLGFDVAELGALLAPAGAAGLTDPDEAPEAPVNPVAVSGDLWALGRHWLLCGDATSADDVAKALNGVQPHLMVTDPPYGVNYDPDWRNRADRANGKPDGARAIGLVSNDDRTDWREAWALFTGDVAYTWCAGTQSHHAADGLEANQFKIRALIVWAKQHFAIGRGDYHEQKEVCWYAVRTGKAGHWSGDRTQSTLWQINKPVKSETGHSTQKPVECMKRPIENNSSPGQAVYDPFVGSGTTIIAAEMTGRACHAIEINPAYADVCIERWQNFTGQKATLDGKTYDEVQTERYDANKDVAGSFEDAYAAVRERVAEGGPSWTSE